MFMQTLQVVHGNSRRYGGIGPSWQYPAGGQCVLRISADGESAVAVTHAFASPPTDIHAPLPPGEPWRITDQFAEPTQTPAHIVDGQLICTLERPFSGSVSLLSRVRRRRKDSRFV